MIYAEVPGIRMWMSLGAIVLSSTDIIHYALLSDAGIRAETSKFPQRLSLSHPLCDAVQESHA